QYAIVDEVDSILIDEARTPLIISGPSEESTDKYYRLDKIIPKLRRDIDYQVDEKHRTVTLTEEGFGRCENLLGVDDLSDIANMEILHHINQALRAHMLYKRDVEYVVKEGEVIIVDEFTGRLMPGRRWSDGLHQGVEAKEGLRIQQENQTLATITFQNYFRMYKKLAGIKHVVLNAKYHEKEAEIVAQAGRKSQVTIATNMAGRGTDILLGGNAEFMARDVLRKREIDPLSATPQQWNEAIAQVKPQID